MPIQREKEKTWLLFLFLYLIRKLFALLSNMLFDTIHNILVLFLRRWLHHNIMFLFFLFFFVGHLSFSFFRAAPHEKNNNETKNAPKLSHSVHRFDSKDNNIFFTVIIFLLIESQAEGVCLCVCVCVCVFVCGDLDRDLLAVYPGDAYKRRSNGGERACCSNPAEYTRVDSSMLCRTLDYN